MRAIVRDRYGSPEVLALEAVAMPAPTDSEVLVRVRASSLNQGDLDYLYGRPFLTRLGIGFKGADVVRLTALIEAGTLKPVIDRTYPLADVPEALRYLDSGSAHGKVVITV